MFWGYHFLQWMKTKLKPQAWGELCSEQTFLFHGNTDPNYKESPCAINFALLDGKLFTHRPWNSQVVNCRGHPRILMINFCDGAHDRTELPELRDCPTEAQKTVCHAHFFAAFWRLTGDTFVGFRIPVCFNAIATSARSADPCVSVAFTFFAVS